MSNAAFPKSRSKFGRNIRIISRGTPLHSIHELREPAHINQDSKGVKLNGNERRLHEKSSSKNTDQDTGTGMEAASKALQELGILKPTEMAISIPSRPVNDMPSPDNAPENKPAEADSDVKSRKKKIANPESLTPTVVLNGLAMARGEQVSYKVIKKTPLPSQPIYETGFYNKVNQLSWANMYYYQQHRYNEGVLGDHNSNYFQKPVKRWIYPYIFHVEVTVGDRSFVGEGKSQQAARHNAAQNALEILQVMPVPKQEKVPASNKKGKKENKKKAEDTDEKKLAKSPISLLYERASGLRLKIIFEVVNEEGPPHLKYFTMKVTIFKPPSGAIVTAEGKGTSKHMAKTQAAAAAVEKLESLSLPARNSTPKQQPKAADAKINAILASANILHPCSRLSQIMQIKHQKMPEYTLLSSQETPSSQPKFVFECSAMDQTATGEGRNKKDAKRVAADNMLKKLGFNVKSSQATIGNAPVKTTMKSAPPKHKSKSTATDILPPLMEVNSES